MNNRTRAEIAQFRGRACALGPGTLATADAWHRRYVDDVGDLLNDLPEVTTTVLPTGRWFDVDPAGLATAIHAATGVAVTVWEVDTGCDEGAVVIGTTRMTEGEAQAFYEQGVPDYDDPRAMTP